MRPAANAFSGFPAKLKIWGPARGTAFVRRLLAMSGALQGPATQKRPGLGAEIGQKVGVRPFCNRKNGGLGGLSRRLRSRIENCKWIWGNSGYATRKNLDLRQQAASGWHASAPPRAGPGAVGLGPNWARLAVECVARGHWGGGPRAQGLASAGAGLCHPSGRRKSFFRQGQLHPARQGILPNPPSGRYSQGRSDAFPGAGFT